MAARPLSQQLIDAGQRLLEEADRIGLNPQGAAWLYDHGLDEWRYVLVSALVDTMGRRKVYLLMVQAFSQLQLPADLTVVDVYLESPRSPLFNALSAFEVRNSLVKFKNCKLDGMLLDGVIYRWDPTPSPDSIKDIERKFVRKAKKRVKA